MAPPAPSGPGLRIRGAHRVALGVHFAVMVAGLIGAAIANRLLSPERIWVHWVAFGWGAVFAVHLAVFARATLATLDRDGDA